MAQKEPCGTFPSPVWHGIYRLLLLGLGKFLTSKNYSFCMLSTRIVKHHPMGTIDKRDKNDSAKIADFLYRYDGTECAKPYKLPSKAMQQLKQLVNERKFLVEQRTNFMNRMQMFETKEDSAMYESYIKSSIMTLRR